MKKILLLILYFLFTVSLLADINSAINTYNSGNYEQAYKEFLPLAKAGNAEAQTGLGNLYANGLGTNKDYEQAVYWYKKAINNGNTPAISNLAGMYFHGLGVKKNIEKAIMLYNDAVNKKDPTALNNLGYIYIYGNGVKKDVSKGISLIIKAAQNDNSILPKYNLSLIYYDGDYGIKNDYKTAFSLMQKAANSHYSKAQCALAKFYFEGKAVKQDLKESYFWAYVSWKNGYKPAERVVNYLSKKLTPNEITIENKKADEWLTSHIKRSYAAEIVTTK